jgi:hypothetical protein
MRSTTFLFKLGAMATIGVLLIACSKGPEGVVEGFYQSLEKGDITKAKTYLSSQVQGMIGDAKLSALLSKQSEHIKSCGGIKSLETKLTGEGEVRRGTNVVTFSGSCPVQTDKIKLVNENGNWKVAADK